MTRDERPDPDALLRRVQAEEARETQARLKVFFGYAPGVGKTYTMLESARRLRALGVDVVAGCVETHGRPETADLLQDLETLPRRAVPYRGTTLEEFDLDAALARRPRVLLLDELAHTNAPGSRHKKRWQDVLDLLEAGVDVHTTLNVQHVESLNDIVAQITLVRVRETVPDSILARADEIEVVDLPPEELLIRLREGKVYVPAQASLAAEHYFRRGNLLALRELTLRRAAERLDEDVRAYRREHDIRTTWPATERLLVCVGPSPASAKVVRAARRMAAGLRASWTAAYVEAPDAYPMRREDRERLQEHLRLAESLGGEVVRLSGQHVSDELLRYAREHNITRIVIGKPTHSRWQDLRRGSLVARLVRGSGDIEVHFIAGDTVEPETRPPATPTPRRLPWRGSAAAGGLVAIATGLALLGRPYLSQPDVMIVYLLAIMLAAFRLSRGASLAAAGLSVAAYDFFFVPPYFTFSVEHARHILTFAMMFGVGLTINDLTSRLRRRGQEARLREARTAALYALTRELASALDEDRVAAVTVRHAAAVFKGDAAVVLRDRADKLAIRARSRPELELADDEMAVARWACDHGRPAGRGTETLPGIRVTCAPIRAGESALGVLALVLPSPEALDDEQRGFLDVFLRQAAISLERARLAEEIKVAALRVRTEETRSSLLSAVSHDLRTPLSAIMGAGTTLRDDAGRLDPAQRAELYDTICGEAERMERLVVNILDMVRLASGGMVPKREWVPLEEIVGSALARTGARLGDRAVHLDLPPDLPPLHVDPVIFEQVFVNLIENAVKYASPDGPLDIGARAESSGVAIEVADRGPGLPPGDEMRVFEKFYRGPGARAGGVGLGLPICLGIVQAHGGTLTAANRAGGGAQFTIRLPLSEPPPVPADLPGNPAPEAPLPPGPSASSREASP